MNIARKMAAFGLLVVMLGTSGCLISREVVTATDHPGENLTLVETRDTYWPVRLPDFATSVYRFWECVDNDGKLSCKMACDGKNDFKCPNSGVAVGTHVIR